MLKETYKHTAAGRGNLIWYHFIFRFWCLLWIPSALLYPPRKSLFLFFIGRQGMKSIFAHEPRRARAGNKTANPV
jgi:hypothetical protein